MVSRPTPSRIMIHPPACLMFFFLAVILPCGAEAALLRGNPDLADQDGDGQPDGWEVEKFIIEDFRGTKCIGMKFPRKDKSAMQGRVTTVFEGPEGFYRVTVSYLDEKDGVSKGKLLVNDQVVRIWNFDGTFGDCWRDEVVENVELKPGDKLTFLGRDNPSEFCRVRSIRVEPSPEPPTAQELEERRNPPVIEEKSYGPLVALRDHRDLSAEESRPEYRPRIVSGSPILALKNAGQSADLALEVERSKRPAVYSSGNHGLTSTGRDPIDFAVMDTDLPYDPVTLAAKINLPRDEGGLFEVRGPNAFWSASVPHVMPVQSREGDPRSGAGSGGYYFYVPAGTTAFGVGAYCNGPYIGEVTVRAPDGTLVTRMDVPKDAAQGVPIRVRPGQDNGVWSLNVEGVSPKIRLCGVPPYVATHPRHLLVPQECVTTTKAAQP